MPTYGYKCTQCGFQFQVMQKMSEDPLKICPECEGAIIRLLYPVGIVFKGTGWYINDSRPPEKGENAEPKAASTDSESATPASPASETPAKTTDAPAKTETTPASTPAPAPATSSESKNDSKRE